MITHRLLAVLLTAAVLAIGPVAADAAIQENLVSYWTFDSTLADSFGANGGSMSAGAATYQAAQFGSGIKLPGGSDDQHVVLPENDNDFDFAAKGNGLTISAWVKVDGFDTAWQALIAKGESNKYRVARYNSTNNMGYAGAGNGSDIQSGVNVNDGLWHHVVAVTEANGTGARLYVDGPSNVVTTSGKPGLGDNDATLRIGFNPEAGGRGWNGVIDDVAIWGRPLTAAEVGMIWSNGQGTAISRLIPEPTTLLIWSLLAGLGIGLGWRRRK